MYYSDDPITKPKEDAFGREFFVTNLANDINGWSGKGSLVIALYGAWGSGKSSVLNLLQNKIEVKKFGEVILFDPWYFNSTEQLIQTFFSLIKEKILEFADKTSENNIKKEFAKYSSSLSQMVSWEPSIELPGGVKLNLGKIGKNKDEFHNPEKIRIGIQKEISKLKQKFIIIIDNLDRLDPLELMLMFKLVRLCSDFPNFIFVLAFDRKQVSTLISKKEIDPNFLEKIIQIDIDLPLIDQEDIDDFIDKSLHNLVNDFDLYIPQSSWDRFFQIYNNAVSNLLIKDLRTAKRYLNSVNFTIPIIREEVNWADFLVLETIRVFYPKIYSGLSSYRKVLTTYDYGIGIEPLQKQKVELINEFIEWTKAELPNKKDIKNCESLIRFLFPVIDAFFQNPQNPSIALRHDEYLTNQQICVSQYFDTYFKFRIPKGEISSITINLIENELNKVVKFDKESIDKIISLITFEKERLSQLLIKLYFRVINLNINGRCALITVLGKIGNILEWVKLDSFNSSGSIAARLIIKCIEGFETNSEMHNAINKLISTTESLPLASDLISRIHSIQNPINLPKTEIGKANKILTIRFNKEIIDKKMNIFATYPESYYLILDVWKSDRILNEQQIVSNYVSKQLSLDPAALPKVLAMYATYELAPNVGLHSLDFKKMGRDFDLHKLLNILEGLGKKTKWTENDLAIITSFKNYMNNKEIQKKEISG